MRRWLSIFLLMLLPLQFSWAAVASYCAHETDAQATHVGHHDHQHDLQHDLQKPADRMQADDDGKAVGAIDVDCGHCHGHCSAAPCSGADLGHRAVGLCPDAWASDTEAAHFPTRPERPQWVALA